MALKSASIIDEHRALMGAVIEKIQSAESGLNGACISLIKGFEVCFSKSVIVWIVPLIHCSVKEETGQRIKFMFAGRLIE